MSHARHRCERARCDRYTLLPVLILLLWTVAGFMQAEESFDGGGEQSHRPIRDAVGFCWSAADTDCLMTFLNGQNDPLKEKGSPKTVLGGIVPHDDYLYAGMVSNALLSRVDATEILIIGVTHGSVRKALDNPEGILILDDFDFWRGPYGPVAVSPLRERIKAELSPSAWMESNQAHALEHSIEALIPILQHRHRDLVITPIMVTAMDGQRMNGLSTALSKIIGAYLKEKGKKWGPDFTLLISADGNHYGTDFDNLDFGSGSGAHQEALAYDRLVLNGLTAGPLNRKRIDALSLQLWGDDFRKRGRVLWCGKYSIPFGLHLLLHLALAQETELKGELLAFSDSFSQGVLPLSGTELGITAPFSLEHWVSFFSLAFF